MSSTFSPAVAKILRDYAPTAAAVLGNIVAPGAGGIIAGGLAKVAVEVLTPKAEMAVQEIGRKLGVDRPTIERINSVILDTVNGKPGAQAPTDLEADLREADQTIALRLAQMAHEEEMARLDHANTANARLHFAGKLDWGMVGTGTATYLMGAFTLAAIMLGWVDLRDPLVAGVVGIVVGHVMTWVGNQHSFYFGSSSGSKRNGDAVRAVATERR